MIGQILCQKTFAMFLYFKKNIGLRSFIHKNQQILQRCKQQQTKSIHMSDYLTYIFEVGRRVKICNIAAQIFIHSSPLIVKKSYGNVRNGRLSAKILFD